MECVALLDPAVDAASGQVHPGQTPRGVVRLRAVDRDVALILASVVIPGGVSPDETDGHCKGTYCRNCRFLLYSPFAAIFPAEALTASTVSPHPAYRSIQMFVSVTRIRRESAMPLGHLPPKFSQGFGEQFGGTGF